MENTTKASLKRILNTALTVLVILSAALLAYVTFCMVRKQPVTFFGKCILQVVTGSMEPTLHVGDCILVERADPAALQVGDIVSYVSEQSDSRGLLITHRIVGLCEDGRFLTRGDANPVDDEPVRPDQIRGRFVRKLHIFGWLSGFSDLRKPVLLIIMIAVSLTALYEVRSVMRVGMELREENQEEERERLMREAIEKEKERLAAEHYQPDSGADASGQTGEPPAPEKEEP